MSEQKSGPVIRIVADSSCDWGSGKGPLGVDYASAPLTIATEERGFRDDEHLDVDEMLGYLAAHHGRSYTACPNVEDWLRCYEGADVVYAVVLSSNISGAYNAAVTAAGLYKESRPGARVHVFDTRSAGPQVRLLVEEIARLVRQGMDFEQVCARADTYLRHTRVFFALESFHNFAQNGRVNKTVAAVAGLLGIRIMATASVKGEISVEKKCRGASGTLKEFLASMREAGYVGGRCRIAQCQNAELAGRLAEKIREAYPGAQIEVYETRGLCSYYAERGGLLLSCECDRPYGEA